MADAEKLLISRVLYHPDDLIAVTDAGISSQHFHDPEHGEVWDWVTSFWQQHGKVPGRDALRMQYPTYNLAKVPEPLSYYVEQINASHTRFEVVDMLSEAAILSGDNEIDNARKLLSERLMYLAQDTHVTQDDDLNKTWKDRIIEYQEIVDRGDELLGIPTGFPTFDLITGGFQPEQFIVLIGPPKAGKSSILLRNAWAANQAGYRVLFIGFEMSNREQAARYDGMRAGFNYMDLLLGKMAPRQRVLLEKAGERDEALPEMLFVHDLSSTTTLTAVTAKIQQYRPDIVFIDGVYMMDSEVDGVESMDTRALTKISRGLKRTAQVLKIPMVISTQALDHKWSAKQGLTANAAGYTSAFGQDCDYMFGIEPADEDDYAKMRLIVGRNAPRKLIMIDFDWEQGKVEEHESWKGGDDLADGEASYG